MNIVWTFRRTARRHGERTFLIDSETSLTYAHADRMTDAIAADLQARGIERGDRVELCAPDQVGLWLAIIGAWKAGALPALLDPQLGPDALPYFIDDIDAKVVVAVPSRHDDLRAAGATSVIALGELGRSDSVHVDRHDADAPLYLSYTSGTTGAPKGAVLRSGPVTLATACIGERLGLTSDDVLLATTPIASSFQLVAALMPAVHAGAAVALVAGRPVDEMWDVARTSKATVMVGYPLTLADIVNAPGAENSTFRIAMSGGSPLAPRIKRDYRDRMGIALMETYGQSEMGGFMAMGSPNDGDRALAGFVGRPLPDRLAYVGGRDHAELPAGEIGEVMVTHGYFDSYRNKPGKFDEATAGGVLHTGDVAVSDADGYLKVLGRTRETTAAVERGGFLRELEDALYEHPAVLHAAVVEIDGGRLAGFFQTLDGEALDPAELLAHAADLVAPALLPASMTQLDEMPRTFSGKADRLRMAASASV